MNISNKLMATCYFMLSCHSFHDPINFPHYDQSRCGWTKRIAELLLNLQRFSILYDLCDLRCWRNLDVATNETNFSSASLLELLKILAQDYCKWKHCEFCLRDI